MVEGKPAAICCKHLAAVNSGVRLRSPTTVGSGRLSKGAYAPMPLHVRYRPRRRYRLVPGCVAYRPYSGMVKRNDSDGVVSFKPEALVA